MKSQATSRERLLEAASELFYRDGVSIGVDALCKAAGVSKKSMYQLFRSKDEVIAESLAARGPYYNALLLPSPDDERPPRDRILAVFERQDELAASDDYYGCPFVATAIELKNPEHPGSVVARHFKQALTDFFRAELIRGGADDPDTAAIQLTMVFDGASSRSVVRSQPLRGVGVQMASLVLETAGLRAHDLAGHAR
ncbi:TetR family transcriptional regulator [Kribbella sp. ALI-6-A]|uniref:TetR/AcrR family transcriptional regulator n=1 Tax=Kribbella sp. ALI-6-A TaxID=1933817 RepID=UPI00097BF501|nr:TetR/AcrR family transcriptional regulator [Kribbella sp. ALI-6-A]ONI68183.1 TetR family transcriptional regulator [Kribbella sp. ALI-6-A]